MTNPRVGILMGSDSDLNIMSGASTTLEELGISYEIGISSAHRTPKRTAQYAENASARGLEVIIAGAGAAAHLAGFVAAHTIIPVIGVPIKSGALEGVDALYSTVQMPPGIPVATVGINGSKNAGILAAQIIASSDPEVWEKLVSYRKKLAARVEEKNTALQELGIKRYMDEQE